mmetsp:Transcript_5767/g.8057  ORF Transcript_5767/g.8057 Transcript_5767/m.8057 type:complete len:521 (+) Transcript_5767:119-1681(+)
MIALAWVIFAAAILGLLLFSWFIVRYYQDSREAEALPTWIATLGLLLALLCVFLIPVDIYSVSITVDSDGNQIENPDLIKSRGDNIAVIYYFLYSCVLAFAFGFIPFAYFYYEEADENVSVKERVWAGCKYTFFLVAIVVILLIVGLIFFYVNPKDKPTNSQEAQDWANDFISRSNVAESSISFSVAILMTLGFLCWITYTAYGLSAFPIGIIKGHKHVTEDISQLQSDLETTREKQREIKSKYLGGKKISKKDESQINLLQRKEKVLSRHGQRLHESQSGWNKIWFAIKPFMFLFGILFLLVSLVLYASILLTNVDKAANSGDFCGSKCGYIISHPKIFNPLDQMMTILAAYFPVDYVFFTGLILYVFLATLGGISKIGIRFLWLHMYKIRRGASPPQGMLIAVIILMLSVLTLNFEITTIAPQYASFGTQQYKDYNDNGTYTLKPCSLDAPQSNCTLTQVATFINRISVRTNFFGILFFYATWVFLAFALIGLAVAIFKAKPSNVEQRDSDSDSDEER